MRPRDLIIFALSLITWAVIEHVWNNRRERRHHTPAEGDQNCPICHQHRTSVTADDQYVICVNTDCPWDQQVRHVSDEPDTTYRPNAEDRWHQLHDGWVTDPEGGSST